MYPVVGSTIRTELTALASSTARLRLSLIESGHAVLPRASLSFTREPFSPIILSSAACAFMLPTTVSLIATRRSPGWTPAFHAGLSRRTLSTTGPPSPSSK